jgi:general secretion pathway protein K
MAILYVLWGIGLLAVIATSVLSAGTVSYALSHTSLEAAQRQAAAEAALARAVLALLDARPDRRWRVDGVPREFTFGEARMRVSIQDELGRIDINQADYGLLTGLFRSAGLTATEASGVADKLLDWRDTSSARRLNGAKDRDYRAAGYAAGPRNGPFQSVDEVQMIMGMTRELYQRVAPAITVYSGRPLFDPQFAPREALLALPGMSPDAVATTVAARESQGARSGIMPPTIPLGGRAFTVRTEISGSGPRGPQEAVIRLTDDPLRPFWVLSWKGN